MAEIDRCLMESAHTYEGQIMVNPKHAFHLLDSLHMFAFLNISCNKPCITFKEEFVVDLDKLIADICRRIGQRVETLDFAQFESDYQISYKNYNSFLQNKELAIQFREVLPIIVQAHYDSVNLMEDRVVLQGIGEIEELKKHPIYPRLQKLMLSKILPFRRALLATFSTEHLTKLKGSNDASSNINKLLQIVKENNTSPDLLKCCILDLRAGVSKYFEKPKSLYKPDTSVEVLTLQNQTKDLVEQLMKWILDDDEIPFSQLTLASLDWLITGMEKFVSQ